MNVTQPDPARAAANPTGTQFAIDGGGYHAVVTEVGAGLRSLEADPGVGGLGDGPGPAESGRYPLIWTYPAEQAVHAGSGQLLAPWPNRVADGRYEFDGATRQLDLSEPAKDNAIHGLTRWMPWRLIAHDADRVSLAVTLHPHPGYPHTLELTATYSVSEAGLAVEVTAVNLGGDDAPYGMAAHPYLTPGRKTGAGAVDEWSLHLPAGVRVTVDDRMLPTGLADVDGTGFDFRDTRPLAGAQLDTAYCGLQRELDGFGRVRVTEPGGGAVTLWLDRGLDWIQIFTADPLDGDGHRVAVAVEPMSCPPDAFNSKTDLIRLAPGADCVHRWGIHAG
ncbi:MAG TPA: aldose 1-epimerase family protein [Actinocrinis sp.]|nr:aldose 1-epimerase family protein [Actinocrinis sp.]